MAAEVGTSKFARGQWSHNKPIGCGSSGVYAASHDDEEEEIVETVSSVKIQLIYCEGATCFDSRSHHQANY
jgi:hypothetical protein